MKSNPSEALQKKLPSAFFQHFVYFECLPPDWCGEQGDHPEGLPAPRDGVQVAVREEPLRQREQRRAGGVQEDHRQEAEGRDEPRHRGSWGHDRSRFLSSLFSFIPYHFIYCCHR